MKEWHRTVVLVILLVVAIGVVVWLRTGYEANVENVLQ